MAKKKQPAALTVVLPGENVTTHITSEKPKLGPGLRMAERQIYATLAGRLQHQPPHTYFILQNLQRYRPAVQDRVLGYVEERIGPDGQGGDFYQMHIGAAHPAVLSNLAFEGATKRNRPHLQTGQVVYARVESVDHHNKVTLSCILGPQDVGVPRKDWMTNEACYGPVRGGTVFRVPTGLARELLKPDCLVLQELASRNWAFEVAIGVNGLVWVHSPTPEQTVAIQNAIQNSQVLTEEQVRAMVQSIVFTAEKQIHQRQEAMEED